MGSDGLGLGVKLQRFESHPPPPPHHHHSHMVHDGDGDQSRPFPWNGPRSGGEDVYSVVAVPLLQQQPFDISAAALHHQHHHHHLSAFKSPGSGTMGTSVGLGFPFTDAQWKELQRQAMVYKYMMASVPVPPDLLLSDPTTAPPLGGGFKLRFSGGADPEPGRCRRTDGKKWRCARDASPDQKYCERHLHRGRPRSRKLVEHQVNAKKTKTKTSHSLTLPIPTPLTSDASNPTISGINGFGTAQNIMVFDRSGERDTTLDHVPRGLEWMMNQNQNQNHSHHTDLNFCEEDNEQSHRFGLVHPNDLKLSMGGSIGNNTIEHEMGRIQTGSGFSGSARTHHHWMSLGGPLAEVLRPSNSSIAEESLNLSSPSGVLQKAALVSLSDSSGSSSPTTFSMPLPMQWLNHQRPN